MSGDEEFEPLFDYHRVQPSNVISLDEDDGYDDDLKRSLKSKKQRTSVVVGIVDKDKCVVIDCEEEEEKEKEEDWLLPPPDVPADLLKIAEDSTIKKLRLQRQELVSTIIQDVDVEDPIINAVSSAFNSALEEAVEVQAKPAVEVQAKPAVERAKIINSIQEKDSQKQFRVYKDENFERLFHNYAAKRKLDAQNLVFSFDGDKINLSETPESLGMEDDDMIEAHVKS